MFQICEAARLRKVLAERPVSGTAAAIGAVISTMTNTDNPGHTAGVMVDLPVKMQVGMLKVPVGGAGAPLRSVEAAVVAAPGPAGVAELRTAGAQVGGTSPDHQDSGASGGEAAAPGVQAGRFAATGVVTPGGGAAAASRVFGSAASGGETDALGALGAPAGRSDVWGAGAPGGGAAVASSAFGAAASCGEADDPGGQAGSFAAWEAAGIDAGAGGRGVGGVGALTEDAHWKAHRRAHVSLGGESSQEVSECHSSGGPGGCSAGHHGFRSGTRVVPAKGGAARRWP